MTPITTRGRSWFDGKPMTRALPRYVDATRRGIVARIIASAKGAR